MNASEVMDINARTTPNKSKPEMKSMEYERSANGGHVFTHRMTQGSGNYHEPETHTFGKDEGKKAVTHFMKHAGISEADLNEGLPKGDADSAAGAAT